MALPVTITGISTAVAPVGPFKSSGGNYYFFGRDSVTATTLQAYKATSAFVVTSNETVNGQQNLGSATSVTKAGQSFTTSSAVDCSGVRVALFKSGSPTDEVFVDLYAVDGSGLPTGASLGTSNTVSGSSLGTSAMAVNLGSLFSFATTIPLAASTKYCFMMSRTGAISGTAYYIHRTNTADVYAGGNRVTWTGSAWFNSSATDAGFILYGSTPTDPVETAWTSAAAKTGFTTAILNIAAYQVNDVIHMAVLDGTMSSSVATKYLSFDAATDTFLATIETVGAAAAITGQASSGWDASIVVRSNGNAVILYNGLQVNTSGTARARLYYRERTGLNVYGTATRVDANTAVDNTLPIAALGSSDRVHFIWFTNTPNEQQRHLTSANVLGTASTMGASSAVDAVRFDDAGTIRHVAAGATIAYRWASADNPTVTSASITFGQVVRTVDDGTDVYALYLNSADGDLYIKKSTDRGATFGSAISSFVGAVPVAFSSISENQTAYQRGSNVVFPYIVNDAGTLKYNEYVVRVTGPVVTHYTMPAAAGAFTLAGVAATLTKTTAVAGTTLDPAKKSSYITLSNGNRTATRTVGTPAFASVFSTKSAVMEDNVYAEVTLTGGIDNGAVGVSNAMIPDSDASGTTNWLGWDSNSLGLWQASVYHNGSIVGALTTTPNTNDVIAIALNRIAQQIYIRNVTKDEDWFPSSGEGYSIASIGDGALYLGFTFGYPDVRTANFDDSFADTAVTTPPSVRWDGSPIVGVTHYTMPAAAGAFALAGQAATTRYGHKMPAAVRTFALSGQTAALRHDYRLVAVKGAFALTGVDATLTKSTAVVHRTMPADAGAFALAGQTAGLRAARKLPVVVGAFTLAGQAATLRYGHAAVAVRGTFTLAGQAAALRYDRKAAALAGAFTLDGKPTALNYVRKLQMSAVSGAFTLTGQTANFIYLRKIKMAAAAGAFTLNGQPSNLIYSGAGDKGMPAAVGAFALNGQAVTLRYARQPLTAVTGAFALSGKAAVLRAARKPLTAVQGTFTLAGQAATLTKSTAVVHRTMPAVAGAVTVSGKTAVLYYTRRLVTELGAVTVSGKPAGLNYGARQNYTMATTPGVVRLEGVSATLSKTHAPPPIHQEALRFGRSVYVSRW